VTLIKIDDNSECIKSHAERTIVIDETEFLNERSYEDRERLKDELLRNQQHDLRMKHPSWNSDCSLKKEIVTSSDKSDVFDNVHEDDILAGRLPQSEAFGTASEHVLIV
jgi:hypothetical protein